MVQPDAVEAAIQQVIPDANVTVEDLTGGGDHLQVTVVGTNQLQSLGIQIPRPSSNTHRFWVGVGFRHQAPPSIYGQTNTA